MNHQERAGRLANPSQSPARLWLGYFSDKFL